MSVARNRNALLHMPTQGRILEGQRALVTGADYITGTTLYVDGGMTLYPAFHEGG